MKRLIFMLGLAILLPSFTGCACLCELERIKMQTFGCLFHGLHHHHGGYGNTGCGNSGYSECGGGGYGGCSPCQGGYGGYQQPISYQQPVSYPQYQGSSGCGCGSYGGGTSYHVPAQGISNYGAYGAPAWRGSTGGCAPCGNGGTINSGMINGGMIRTPNFEAPLQPPIVVPTP